MVNVYDWGKYPTNSQSIVYRTKIKIDDINFIVVVQACCYGILIAITYVQQKLLKNSEGVANTGSVMVITHQNDQ